MRYIVDGKRGGARRWHWSVVSEVATPQEAPSRCGVLERGDYLWSSGPAAVEKAVVTIVPIEVAEGEDGRRTKHLEVLEEVTSPVGVGRARSIHGRDDRGTDFYRGNTMCPSRCIRDAGGAGRTSAPQQGYAPFGGGLGSVRRRR